MWHRHHLSENGAAINPEKEAIADVSIPDAEVKNWKRALGRGGDPLSSGEIQVFLHTHLRKQDAKAHARAVAFGEDLIRVRAILENILERKLSREEEAALRRQAEKLID